MRIWEQSKSCFKIWPYFGTFAFVFIYKLSWDLWFLIRFFGPKSGECAIFRYESKSRYVHCRVRPSWPSASSECWRCERLSWLRQCVTQNIPKRIIADWCRKKVMENSHWQASAPKGAMRINLRDCLTSKLDGYPADLSSPLRGKACQWRKSLRVKLHLRCIK